MRASACGEGGGMRVLVACEYSGRVREAFRAIGHDAWCALSGMIVTCSTHLSQTSQPTESVLTDTSNLGGEQETSTADSFCRTNGGASGLMRGQTAILALICETAMGVAVELTSTFLSLRRSLGQNHSRMRVCGTSTGIRPTTRLPTSLGGRTWKMNTTSADTARGTLDLAGSCPQFKEKKSARGRSLESHSGCWLWSLALADQPSHALSIAQPGRVS